MITLVFGVFRLPSAESHGAFTPPFLLTLANRDDPPAVLELSRRIH